VYKYTKDPNGSKHTVILSLQSERKNLVNGLLVPQTFSDHSMTVRKYQYRILSSDRTEHITAPPISGKFVIHAPSLIGILAYAILANAPSASGMILEKAWTDSNSWLLAHLYYERMRFGSDVCPILPLVNGSPLLVRCIGVGLFCAIVIFSSGTTGHNRLTFIHGFPHAFAPEYQARRGLIQPIK